jgi:hypothetical protein
MSMTPEQRLARLTRHAVQGWARARSDTVVRERAREWLLAHPSAMPAVDELWLAALAGTGPLSAWIESGAAPDAWQGDQPLHSVLACHPFPDLPQWLEVRK